MITFSFTLHNINSISKLFDQYMISILSSETLHLFFLWLPCSIVVNPANISSGLHYFEVYGIDYKAPWRGPIFRVPITVIKPITLLGEPPLLSISNLSFQSGIHCYCLLKVLFANLYIFVFGCTLIFNMVCTYEYLRTFFLGKFEDLLSTNVYQHREEGLTNFVGSK